MGRKINPNGFRLAYSRDWSSQWYAHKRDFAECLHHDYLIRQHIMKSCKLAMISKILITRLSSKSGPTIEIHAARPGMIIGSKGEEIDLLRAKIRQITSTQDATVDVKEVRDPEANASLIAQNIATRLEKRQRTRRVIQSAFQSIARQSQVLGVKIRVKGRLDGADIARQDYRHEGRVPLHTLRANIDYGFAEANTTMGQIGIKVWIFTGENTGRQKQPKHSLTSVVEASAPDGEEATIDAEAIEKAVAKPARKESKQEFESDDDFLADLDEDFADDMGDGNAGS